MKRLAVVLLLALMASILFSSNVLAKYLPADNAKLCNILLNRITTAKPLSPAFENLLAQAARQNCGEAMDRGALIALYYNTGGDHWTYKNNWDNSPYWFTTPDHCQWFGINCAEGRVFALYLVGNNLVGEIPSELEYLSELLFLYLSSNQLSGPIPLELGELSKITDINLKSNQLSGPIPSELSTPPYLWILNLADNQLSGSIPPELGMLPELSSLDLSNNQLSGQIPHSFINYQNRTWPGTSDPISLYFYIGFGSIPGGNTGLCIPIDVYNALVSTTGNDFQYGHICQ